MVHGAQIQSSWIDSLYIFCLYFIVVRHVRFSESICHNVAKYKQVMHKSFAYLREGRMCIQALFKQREYESVWLGKWEQGNGNIKTVFVQIKQKMRQTRTH